MTEGVEGWREYKKSKETKQGVNSDEIGSLRGKHLG